MRGAYSNTISHAKGERPLEIHKEIFAFYGNVMNRQDATKWCLVTDSEQKQLDKKYEVACFLVVKRF